MSCPHSSHGSPDRCSICLGVKPRIVEQAGPELLVDGVAVRAIEPPQDPHIQQPRKRHRGKR